MRAPCLLLFALVVSGCAAGSQAVQMTMPPLHAEVGLARMGPARLEAGSTQERASFHLTILFDSDEADLGDVNTVAWQMSLDGYCRDRGGIVSSVLVGPSGRIWRARPVFVPPGPDRAQDWASGGFADEDGQPGTPELLSAMSAGGRFTLAIEDDEGELWNPVLIDTLTPAQRRRLFSANRAAFEATDHEGVSGEIPVVLVYLQPTAPPWPPRPCPEVVAEER